MSEERIKQFKPLLLLSQLQYCSKLEAIPSNFIRGE